MPTAGAPVYGERMPHVYILRCSDDTFYVGSTLDLDRRFEQHNAGLGAAYTRRRLPVTREALHPDRFATPAFLALIAIAFVGYAALTVTMDVRVRRR